MNNFILTAFSLTAKTVQRLENFKKKTKISKSKLIRMFINYFNENPSELKKLIKGDYDID